MSNSIFRVKSYLLQQAQLRLLPAVAQQLFLFLEFLMQNMGHCKALQKSGDDSTTGFYGDFMGF